MDRNSIFSKCRACFKNVNGLKNKIHLFDVFNDKRSTVRDSVRISDLFQKYTSILITEKDSLPEYICGRCYKKLRDFHEFYNECNASNAKLLEQRHSIENQSSECDADENSRNISDQEKKPQKISVKKEVDEEAVTQNGENLGDNGIAQAVKVEVELEIDSDHGLDQTFSDESDYNVDSTFEEKPAFDGSTRIHHAVNDAPSALSRFICDVGGCGKTFKLKVPICQYFSFGIFNQN